MNTRPRRRPLNLAPNVIGTPEEPAQPTAGARPADDPTPTRARTSFHHTADDGSRARAAWMHTRLMTGITTYSEFVAAAVREKVAQLERDHNDGEPFGEIDTLPPGRKM